MITLRMRRLGVIMTPKPGEPTEAEGVLNPAAVRGPDGHLYLFPRLVGARNYSRIGIARVQFDDEGNPVGVERLGVVLEPQEDYELWPDGRGGCEDPRVTFVEPLGHYVMTYTAYSSRGPRIAFARSNDLFHWERLGLARFRPHKDIVVDGVDNKDASVFPTFIADPVGKPSIGMLHRPLFPGTRPEEIAESGKKPAQPELQSIWISYDHTDTENRLVPHRQFSTHRRLAKPKAPWEALKIGSGTPPVRCDQGWLIVYHGVHELPGSTPDHQRLSYSAGIMILDYDHPHRILYRSPEPALSPETPEELFGAVDGVVFPTGIDKRDDIGQPNRFDVYYGMADDRIGVATFDLPPMIVDRAKPDQ